jgi:hypothetical protein
VLYWGRACFGKASAPQVAKARDVDDSFMALDEIHEDRPQTHAARVIGANDVVAADHSSRAAGRPSPTSSRRGRRRASQAQQLSVVSAVISQLVRPFACGLTMNFYDDLAALYLVGTKPASG